MKPPHKNHTKEAIPVIAVFILLTTVLLLTDPTITGFATLDSTSNTTINITPLNETNQTENNTENLEPTLLKTIPDIEIQNQTINISLNEYFQDPENQTLFYDLNNIENLNTTIEEHTLIINKNTQPGKLQIYATDGENTITSNEFTIQNPTFLETTNTTINQTTQEENTTNTTTNQTTNETTNTTTPTQEENTTNTTTNQTTNTTNQTTQEENTEQETITETTPTQQTNTTNQTTQEENETNTTTNQTNNQSNNTNTTLVEDILNCENPDPNLRPIECIENNTKEFYDMENIYITNNNRIPVARINPVGNILIRGNIIENSNSEPAPEDFKVTKLNQYYEEITMAYIDTNTGDLHIKGTMTEEDFFLKPTKGAYTIQNKRNVNLAYIDINTGDLHIKNNLIQNRESIS